MVAAATAVEATGAEAGRHVLVDTGGHAAEQLGWLAGDPRLAARLSCEGRTRYEAAHSVARAADDVVAAVGAAPRWPPSSLQLRLNELDARRGEAQRKRVDEMVGAIVDRQGDAE